MPLSSLPTGEAHDPAAVSEATAGLPPEEILELVAETLAALGDPTRARLLYALARRPLCVRDLSLVAGVSESAVSHQLRLLRDRRLVKARRSGVLMIYELDDHHVHALFREAEYHADHVLHRRPDHPYSHRA